MFCLYRSLPQISSGGGGILHSMVIRPGKKLPKHKKWPGQFSRCRTQKCCIKCIHYSTTHCVTLSQMVTPEPICSRTFLTYVLRQVNKELTSSYIFEFILSSSAVTTYFLPRTAIIVMLLSSVSERIPLKETTHIA